MTGKMFYSGNAGFENRTNSSVSSNWQPRFESGWHYQPFDGTSLGISGYRRVSAYLSGTSLDMGQILGWNGEISQRLFQRLNFNLSGGVETIQNDTANFSSRGTSQTRSFVGASLGYSFHRWVGGSVFCQAASNSGATSYTQTTFGVQLTAHY